MPQLRRNRSLAKTSQRPQFPQCQPRIALRRSQHHIANHLPLRTQPPRIVLPAPHRNRRLHGFRKFARPEFAPSIRPTSAIRLHSYSAPLRPSQTIGPPSHCPLRRKTPSKFHRSLLFTAGIRCTLAIAKGPVSLKLLQVLAARARSSSGHAVWPAMRTGEFPARAANTCAHTC